MRELLEGADEPLLRLEFCAASHTLVYVRGERCHAKTLLAVNEEVDFLGGQMTVVHDSLRWVVRAGWGWGFSPFSETIGQTGKRANEQVEQKAARASCIPSARLPVCPFTRVSVLFTFASKRFTQLVPRPVDVRLHGSKR